MKKLFSIISILFISYSFGEVAKADEYISCNKCSSADISSAADSWGLKNISESDSKKNIRKKVNIVDLVNLKSSSYLVSKKNSNGTFYIEKNRISPSEELKEKLDDVIQSKEEMNLMSSDLVIPKEVIKDPWEFVGCSYCVVDLQNFLNNSLQGQISQFNSAVQTLAYTFGLINGPYQQTFTLKFAGGGSTTFEVKQVTNTYDFVIIKILQVVDESGNEIPLNRANANFKSLRIPSHDRWQIINNYLWRYRLSIPPTDGGVVTVTECPLAPQHNCW
ncbi:hypothetical protein VH1709_contig00031-0002 [Vibrio harveyi]|uniref:hypothetical protein n=1 Tax=Vibrio harveyi TaxID=669 RepID=UPI000D78283E|nr:hypothetical protein [Vibrio harveyi]GBK99172.1 hypothetical protein VH1709_contig00031-0002 [Vibrio harveyi]